MRRFGLLLALVAAAGVPAGTAAADLTDRLAACAACHGKHGEGARDAESYYPHLAGKPAGYLFEQLRGFRDGRRTNAAMTWYVRFADDAYLREIAEHYAAQPPRTMAADTGPATLSEAQREVAERLVQHGDPARNVPPCSACHGEALTGIEPGVPALLALPADYVVAQFGNWRNGVRRGAPPDCMRDVASAIDAADIRAIATWLSHQSQPADARPAPAGSFEPPRKCGSLPSARGTP
jgi:cytochrome c553